MRHREFYMENPYTKCGNKKLRGLRPTNLNPLYKIKLHRFSLLLHSKDLLSNIYNLIHVYDVATFLIVLVDHFNLTKRDEGPQTKIQISNP